MKQHYKRLDLNQLIDRSIFGQLVEKWGVDLWVRELRTWELTCALVTAMTMRLGSYREIELALGIPRATLGDALVRRSAGFFNDLCDHILLSIRGRTTDRRVKRAIRQILALDASEIKVHGSLFSSPNWQQKSAAGHLAAAKVHVMWSVDGEWIDDFLVTGGRISDCPVSRLFNLRPNVVYVFDRAYSDLGFWVDIKKAGSDFVTRLKAKSIRRMSVGKEIERQEKDGVLCDGAYTPGKDSVYKLAEADRINLKFRYIVYRDPLTKKVFHFVTSDWKSSAQAIADIYKRRWAIELLFRWLKGHLDIRYLASKNKNVVKIQIAIAVLVQLLLWLKKVKEKYSGTLWELLREIRTTHVKQTLAISGVPEGCRWRSPMNKGSGDFAA